MGKAVTGGGLSPVGIENLKIAIVKQALHKAAKLNDLGYKDYMKVRRKAGME